jgi:hypothetical protein
VVFDFKNQKLSFDAENFRTTLSEYKKIKRKITLYHFTNVWELSQNFAKHGNRKERLVESSVQTWLENYEKGTYFAPGVVMPSTGYLILDAQLNRALDLWKSYVNACREINPDVMAFKQWVAENDWRKTSIEANEDVMSADDLISDWNTRALINEIDNWSKIMLLDMFGTIEDLLILPTERQSKLADELNISLNKFFNNQPKTEKELDDTIKELIDLLNLPVWKRRHELFSTWILAVLDKTFAKYTKVLHDNNGILLLRFTGTCLMTITTVKGPIQLWAENRTPAVNPTGHGRKNGIQPDYTLYQASAADPKNCIACVEVKQYKKASVSNFRHAINDYANGLVNAEISLLNYGPVPSTISLDFLARSSYYGGIKPGSAELEIFQKEFLLKMPIPKGLTGGELVQVELDKQVIEHIFVDVSGTMNNSRYKKYIRLLLNSLIGHKSILKLTALDATKSHIWQSPDHASVDELLNLHFYGGDDFDPQVLKNEGHCLVVTDVHHIRSILDSGHHPFLIVLNEEEAKLYVFEKNLNEFHLQQSELLTGIFGNS